MKQFNQANERYEKAVKKLQENLQYLADQGKVSDRFLNIQNGILEALIDYQHEVLSTLEVYNGLVSDLTLEGSVEYRKLLDIKESFEAICIIHGIMDFQVWLMKGKKYLIAEAVCHYRNGQIQIPSSLRDHLKSQGYDSLWASWNSKSIAEWEAKLRQLGFEIRAYA